MIIQNMSNRCEYASIDLFFQGKVNDEIFSFRFGHLILSFLSMMMKVKIEL